MKKRMKNEVLFTRGYRFEDNKETKTSVERLNVNLKKLSSKWEPCYMFQLYPKDFEMIIIEKRKFDFDVLEHIYEYESKTKKMNLKQKNGEDIR